MEHDADVLNRLTQLWFTAPPRPPALRIAFWVNWQASDGTEFAFNSVITPWDEFDARRQRLEPG